MRTLSFPLSGMTCGGCVAAATKALQAVPGVQSVQVSLEERSALITADERVTESILTAAVTQAGFTLGPPTAQA